VSITTIANRYGRALADVVLEKGEQPEVQAELRSFVTMFAENPQLQEVFANPTVTQQQQRALLNAIIARVRPKNTTSNFLQVLLKNYRLQHLPDIYQAFARILDERLNIISAEVTTALPISTQEQAVLNDKLRKLTGKEVRLKFIVDANIIGGVSTRIGSQIYDGSIRNQLEQLRLQIRRQ
jgi:ATP synthase F1 delta subunit